jgi:hypothetical protein
MLTPSYQEKLKRGLYVLDYCSTQPTDKHRLEPACTGDKLQQVKENHPNKTCDGASYANPEICDGAERFGYDFVNTALTSKVNAQEVPGIRVLAS